jgi:serine/threonine protein kinase
VYVAKREDVPEHQVAMKILPKSLYVGRNVERELVMLATVGHPHIVQLKDHGTTADYVWLTMPVYEGETLEERLKRGPLSLREAHDIFLPIARGIEALHTAGLRHQDIKPDNIFLAIFGARVHPVLLDLGVAAEREATFVAGTMLYASPEQLDAMSNADTARPLTEKMDTYCLAATLLVSLVTRKHFPGQRANNATDLADAQTVRAEQPIADGVLDELSGRSRGLLIDSFRRWLSLDPTERPSISKLAEQLDVLLEPEREAAEAEELKRARQKTSLLRVRAAAAAMLLIGCAGLAVAYSKRETLRVAGELDKARAQGAESFDKLDTCNASHAVAKREAADCKVSRDVDRTEYKQALHAITRTGSTAEAERARQLTSLQASYTAKLKTCEDDSQTAAQAAQQQQKQLDDSWAAERTALIAARDEQKTLADNRAAEITKLIEQIDRRAAEQRANEELYEQPRSPGPAPAPGPSGAAAQAPPKPPAAPNPPAPDNSDPYN